LALLLVLSLAATPAAAYPCQRLLWFFGLASRLEDPFVAADGVTVEIPKSGDGVLANGVLVTGTDDYPLSVMQHHLGLEKTPTPTLPGKTLSLGEGYSRLLPALADNGNDVTGIDLWYHSDIYPGSYDGKQMRAFNEKYRKHLIRGTATKLPADDESFDHVVSHELVNNVPLEVQRAIVMEAVRVTARGGDTRLFGFKETDARATVAAVEEKYGAAVTTRLEKHASDFLHPYAGRVSLSGWLLIVDKAK